MDEATTTIGQIFRPKKTLLQRETNFSLLKQLFKDPNDQIEVT